MTNKLTPRYTWADQRPWAVATMQAISEAAGTKVFSTDKLDSFGMDSLDWLGVLHELNIDVHTKLPETVEDLIVQVGKQLESPNHVEI